MLSDTLVEALCCTVCGGRPLDLIVEETDGDRIVLGTLACPDCKRWFPVRDDIPRMMPPDLASNLVSSDEDWGPWTEAMRRFLQWREAAWSEPAAAESRRAAAREMHRAFIAFCALPDDPIALLDVGCGTGHAADLLPESVTYIGIDPLAAGAAPGAAPPEGMPRPQRPASLVQGVGEALPFADDSFDAALVMGTLDHCRSPEEMLAQVARVLRPGATLGLLQGISTPEPRGLMRSLLRSLQGGGEQSPTARETHMRSFFSPDEVADLLSAWFDVQDLSEHSGRAFVRATPGEGRA